MKILLLAHIEPTGGTGTYFYRLINFLHEQKHEVFGSLQSEDIISLPANIRNKISTIDKYIKHTKIEHFIFRCFRKIGLEYKYLYFRDLIVIKNKITKTKPDLIIVSQGGGTEYFPVLKFQVPVLFIIHSLFGEYEVNKKNFFLKHMNISKIQVNKRIINVSNYATELFITYQPFYLIAKNCYTIPNYGELINFQKEKHSEINVMTIGHLNGYKNPLLWYEIAKEITSKNSCIHFYWAGIGEFYSDISNQITQISNIHLLGFQTDITHLYAISDIYFQPSILESQGIAVVEALGADIPCIVSNAGGLPESIDNGVNGFVCEVNDKQQYIDALLKLINDEKLRIEMGINARRKFEEKFTKEIWESKMIQVIQELTNANASQ